MLWPQRAFNLELAGIRDSTRGNAVTGALRFAFWREVVEAVYNVGPIHRGCSYWGVLCSPPCSNPSLQGETHPHPLSLHLLDVVQAHGHTRRFMEKLIDARVSVAGLFGMLLWRRVGELTRPLLREPQQDDLEQGVPATMDQVDTYVSIWVPRTLSGLVLILAQLCGHDAG